MKLLSAGVNGVVVGHNSDNHAETMAQGIAQQRVEYFSIKRAGLTDVTLATSCEPCAKCLGSIDWAGLNRVLIGAPKDYAEAIGFNEGNKPPNWREYLTDPKPKGLGLYLREGICVPEAAIAFERYKAKSGIIYNGEGEENLVMGIRGAKIRLSSAGSLIQGIHFAEPGKSERELGRIRSAAV